MLMLACFAHQDGWFVCLIARPHADQRVYPTCCQIPSDDQSWGWPPSQAGHTFQSTSEWRIIGAHVRLYAASTTGSHASLVPC
jgi:hypothetical protein